MGINQLIYNIPLDLLERWFKYCLLLIPQVCVVVVMAFVSIRCQWFRRALRGVELEWKPRISLALIFGVVGIFSDFAGIRLNLDDPTQFESFASGNNPLSLKPNEAVIGLRYALVLAGGLIGGPWVGLGAGLLAGAGRYFIMSGRIADVATITTLLLGLGAGGARYYLPKWSMTTTGVLVVGLTGTAVRGLLIFFSKDANGLSIEAFIPYAVVNVMSCVLFVMIMRDLDRDWLEREAREAKFRAVRAQVEPHMLNNTLSAVQSLVYNDPDKAYDYIGKLGKFFAETREQCASIHASIPLKLELGQLKRYLEFQQLRFPEKLDCDIDNIPHELLDCQIPSRSLLTLTENALTHGRRGHPDGFELRVCAEDLGDSLAIRVKDNGCGIPPERLVRLGKERVDSKQGEGSALYQLQQSLVAFPGRAGLNIASEQSKSGAYTEITLTLPKLREPW